MNNDLKKLLISERDNVLNVQNERKLSKEEQFKRKTERIITSNLDLAEEKGKELINIIAKKLIEKYIEELESPLYPTKRDVNCSFNLSDLHNEERLYKRFDYEHIKIKGKVDRLPAIPQEIWNNYIGLDNKFSDFNIKEMLNKRKKCLGIWTYELDRNDYSDVRYNLVCIDVDFFKKQGIKISTKNKYGIATVTFTKSALSNFVKNVFEKKYSEITLDDSYLEAKKNRLIEIENEKIELSSIDKISNLNAEIIALDICKLAINKYKERNCSYDSGKEIKFSIEVKTLSDATSLFGEKESNILNKYWYNKYVFAFPHQTGDTVKYLPVLSWDIENLLDEISISAKGDNVREKYYFNLNIILFESVILENSNEEVKKK